MSAAESERLLGSSVQEHELDRLVDDLGHGQGTAVEPPPVLRTSPGGFQRRALVLSARCGSLQVTNSRETL